MSVSSLAEGQLPPLRVTAPEAKESVDAPVMILAAQSASLVTDVRFENSSGA
jgi:hypothetical protein